MADPRVNNGHGEAGKAARWLSSCGLPGAGVLARLLMRNDGKPFTLLCPVELATGPWHGRSQELCLLIAGASLVDRAALLIANQETTLGRIAHPILTLPFVARAVALMHQGLHPHTQMRSYPALHHSPWRPLHGKLSRGWHTVPWCRPLPLHVPALAPAAGTPTESIQHCNRKHPS